MTYAEVKNSTYVTTLVLKSRIRIRKKSFRIRNTACQALDKICSLCCDPVCISRFDLSYFWNKPRSLHFDLFIFFNKQSSLRFNLSNVWTNQSLVRFDLSFFWYKQNSLRFDLFKFLNKQSSLQFDLSIVWNNKLSLCFDLSYFGYKQRSLRFNLFKFLNKQISLPFNLLKFWDKQCQDQSFVSISLTFLFIIYFQRAVYEVDLKGCYSEDSLLYKDKSRSSTQGTPQHSLRSEYKRM